METGGKNFTNLLINRERKKGGGGRGRRGMSAPLSFSISHVSPYSPQLSAFFTSISHSHLLLARAASPPHALIGYCEGSSSHGGVYCSRLAVSQSSRSQGVGTALLSSLYHAASPAQVAHLCTMEYQGPTYYPKLGYHADHTLSLRSGRTVTYFSRALDAPACAGVAAATHPAFTIASVPADAEALQEEARAFVRREFDQHSMERVGGLSGFFAFALEARAPAAEGGGAAEGQCLGALEAMSYWGLLVIGSLEVLPEHRRRGIGRALLAAATAHASAKGCSEAVAEVLSPSQAAACALLTQAGFAQAGSVGGFEGGQVLLRLTRTLPVAQ